MNKKKREEFYNKIQEGIPNQDYITLIKIQSQLEQKLSDLRKKLYSVEFVEERVKKLYLNNQPFTQFLIKLIGEI